ncbi:hypothetical protein AAG747_21980 [Rapidithrix thailandica]|uniref:SWIM-type domain-containing protein n=1 Tax=Rapidithrix thailandica TaxID=413964 RepID=A0AAW9S0A8_9BACT
MTLKDFEQEINPTIVERGFAYFTENVVNNLDKVAPGMWLAQVHGSEVYTVEIRTHRTKIKSWSCDCPYDGGPVCKHVTAMLYAIAEQMDLDKAGPSQKGGKKRMGNKEKIEEILNKASQKDLQAFILSQFKKNLNLKNAFIAHFAEHLSEDQEEKYRLIVRNLYKVAQGRRGFVEYRSANTLFSSLNELAQKAANMLVKKNLTEALIICKTLIEEVPVMLQNADDSSGRASDVIHNTWNTIHQLTEQAPPLMKDELYAYCHSEYPKEKYKDLRHLFVDLMIKLISTGEQEEQFLALIECQIEKEKSNPNHFSSEYKITQLLLTKLDYLKRLKKAEEIVILLENNKQYPPIRKVLVEQALARKDFERAKGLCQKGIEIAREKQHLGTVRSWQQTLLEVAVAEENIPDIRKKTKELYLASPHHHFDYYRKLKATYSPKEWPAQCENIINTITTSINSYDVIYLLAAIYIEEGYHERLLKLIQKQPKSLTLVDSYAQHLQDAYPEELLALYESSLKAHATNTGRNIYNEVVTVLEKVRKIKGGQNIVEQLVSYFRMEYSKRKAMMEILNKYFPEIQ